MHTVHGKQREFKTELVAILQREALLQHVNLSKNNNESIEEKETLEKKLKAKHEKARINNEKIEQLQANNDVNIKLLANCDTHVETLQDKLKQTKEFAAGLQAALDDNTQVESLQQALKEKTELADQLKTALESSKRENKALEENSLEANIDLEESIKKYEEIITSSRKQYLGNSSR